MRQVGYLQRPVCISARISSGTCHVLLGQVILKKKNNCRVNPIKGCCLYIPLLMLLQPCTQQQMVGVVFFCGDGENCVHSTKPASFQRDLELKL